jgi:hypothetical protein
MRDKIKKILHKFLNDVHPDQYPSNIGDTRIELEKYILSLLEEQRKLCAFSLSIRSECKEYPTDSEWFKDIILSTPYPVESNLIVLDKEKLKGILDYTTTKPIIKTDSDRIGLYMIIEKEFGIKII